MTRWADGEPFSDQLCCTGNGDALFQGDELENGAAAIALRGKAKPVMTGQMHDELARVRAVVDRAGAGQLATDFLQLSEDAIARQDHRK